MPPQKKSTFIVGCSAESSVVAAEHSIKQNLVADEPLDTCTYNKAWETLSPQLAFQFKKKKVIKRERDETKTYTYHLQLQSIHSFPTC